MRLLALAPLLALAAAKPDLDLDLLDLDLDLPASSPLCPSGASTSTLWLAEGSAFACAPLPGGGSYAPSGSTCITTAAAGLQGSRNLCEGAGDCVGGLCVELGGGMSRVCWTVASNGECGQFGKST